MPAASWCLSNSRGATLRVQLPRLAAMRLSACIVFARLRFT
jgi:hypothetical protein